MYPIELEVLHRLPKGLNLGRELLELNLADFHLPLSPGPTSLPTSDALVSAPRFLGRRVGVGVLCTRAGE